jgi:hypothetical protein
MLMICSSCSHHNDGGKFCEQCGTPLTAPTSDATTVLQPKREEAAAAAADATTVLQPNREANGAPNQHVPNQYQGYNQPPYQGAPQQPNRYIESTKKVSKMYFGYFLQVLKQPYASTQKVGAEHLINGIITMVLYAFLIPFTLYFFIKNTSNSIGSFFGSSSSIEVPFSEVVLKPTLAFAIFIFLICLFTLAAVKLGRSQASFQEVTARFGSLLIPIVAILLVALIMSLLDIKLFVVVLLLALLGSIFLVPALVIASFKKDSAFGLDAIYGTFVTYILTFIAFAIMGDMLASSLMEVIEDAMYFF